jgi:hypothetical protein
MLVFQGVSSLILARPPLSGPKQSLPCVAVPENSAHRAPGANPPGGKIFHQPMPIATSTSAAPTPELAVTSDYEYVKCVLATTNGRALSRMLYIRARSNEDGSGDVPCWTQVDSMCRMSRSILEPIRACLASFHWLHHHRHQEIHMIASKKDQMSCRLIQTLRDYPNTKDFVYLRRIDRSPTEYNPYALRVVSFDDIGSGEFYTLSVNGITFYCSSVEGDFTELQQWERELRVFNALKQLRLWRLFRTWKVCKLQDHASLKIKQMNGMSMP